MKTRGRGGGKGNTHRGNLVQRSLSSSSAVASCPRRKRLALLRARSLRGSAIALVGVVGRGLDDSVCSIGGGGDNVAGGRGGEKVMAAGAEGSGCCTTSVPGMRCPSGVTAVVVYTSSPFISVISTSIKFLGLAFAALAALAVLPALPNCR